jgi:hypothetical protein
MFGHSKPNGAAGQAPQRDGVAAAGMVANGDRYY